MNQPCSQWLVQAAVRAVDSGLGLNVTGAARPRGLLRELEWQDPAPGVSRFVAFFKTTSYDAATQTEKTSHYREVCHTDERHQSLVKELTWHHCFPCELRGFLHCCGLVPVAEYGDYDQTPFSATSSHDRWIMAPA